MDRFQETETVINYKVATMPNPQPISQSTLPTHSPAHCRLLKLASGASVATASLLITIKLIAWFMTGSLSLLATLLDSAMDVVAAIITLIAVRIAVIPADDNHHFGHGKAEQLAVLAQSAFIAGSAIVLLLSALDRVTDSHSPLANETMGIVVMVLSMVATACLLLLQHYVIRKTGSPAIKADALHYQVDILTNAAVIAALVGAHLGYYQLDNLLALGISGYMLYSVKPLAWQAIQQLMDQSLPPEQLLAIEQQVLSVKGVQGVHQLRTRVSGSIPFIQMHLDLPGSLSLQQAHAIGDRAKAAVLHRIPGADITIHLDPSA